ncbi:MAG: hypothetical protein K0R50_2258 [Eubacterium sp.]|nr:hypothetical protein [Eubacterium sp.]
MGKGFVLIPGAGMSDWIWKKLLPLLKYKAVTIPQKIEVNSYENRLNFKFEAILDYAGKVIEQSGLEEIIVVGHSGAGLIAAELAKRNRKVKHAVFLAANLPENGGTALDSFPEEIRKKNIEAVVQQARSDTIPMKKLENSFRTYFCNRTTEADMEYILQQDFQPEPVCVLTHKVDWTDYPSIGRTYILCTEDVTVTKQQQEGFAANLKIADLRYMESDHMCMISHAEALAEELNIIAETL